MYTAVTDALGWMGSMLFILGYYLVSSGRIDGEDWVFNLISLLSALLLLLYSFIIADMPFIVVNGTWAVLTVFALARRR